MTYTNSNDFGDYFGIEPPTNYEQLEDLAVSILTEYCVNFPSKLEYLTLNDFQKDKVTKAIYYEIYHIINNPSLLTGINDYSSVKLGRLSITKSDNSSNDEYFKYNNNAITFLDQAGICKHTIGDDCCDCCDTD